MITAKIIAHSVYHGGPEIITYELEYPRMIHSELMTHRIFSKNSASSRAIPIMTMIKAIWNNPAEPVHWGKNQAGMSAKEELTGWRKTLTQKTWRAASKVVCGFAFILSKIGAHKQIANRITEPFSHIKIVLTGTSFDNWFALRDHEAAQPEIQVLARLMKEAKDQSIPNYLAREEWHLPYVTDRSLQIEDALKLSASLCAQTSYRKADDSLEKAKSIFGKLIDSYPVHFSPTEHQARPLWGYMDPLTTHTDKIGRFWSGNFCGWGQYRQQIQIDKKLEAMTSKLL